MTAWRLLDTGPLGGALNMAVDLALMERARITGERVFRVYGWERRTVSLGRNQTARDLYDVQRLQQRGIDVVRRPTGGRAILHWRELTYSVTARAESMTAAAAIYTRINELLVRALQRLGITAEITRSRSARPPDHHPCFAEPSAGEIVVRTAAGDGKLVGSAQYLENGALLQHGSILLHDDQALLQELTGETVKQTRAASVSEALGRDVPASAVAKALLETVRLSPEGHGPAFDLEEIRPQAEAHVNLFLDPLWTWRR